ncbi:MAG: hypothetical protein ACE5DX_05985, partial [Candidatus Dojkabacteria bacterium]
NLPNQVGMQALTMVELGISRDDIVSGGTSALNSVNGRGVIHVVDTTGRNAADVAGTVQKLITL